MEVVAAVKKASLSLYQDGVQSYHRHVKFLAVVGALYTARKLFSILRGCCSLVRMHITSHLFGRTSLVRQYGEWAVVTGATDGIGKAYAEELARHGLNIILISRSSEKLTRVSEAIAETYGVKTSCIQVDFSHGRDIYPIINEALRQVEVGILVNNVGLFVEYPQYFLETPEDRVWELINVNVAAAVMMTRIVLPGMTERKRGAIVNVSSASCVKPCPLMAVYSASKSFMDHFSQALHYEYASKGIFIQTLVPFFIVTKLTSFSTFLLKKSILVPTAKDYAYKAVQTLGKSHRTTGHWSHSIQFAMAESIPEWTWVPIIKVLCRKLRQEYNSSRS
ncbi:inactive hydroxysteroid dehydrogenase-like protein 1 [Bombina bombina]|uniref:inactive hydroxysteroid dehydrogenase-like protein 1 n=1 Tax=Bombina bombina TaxID=8345 RepID=UPI00235A607F|nr:inactive hydroxysteroid dehydrogenase-like protein 1 [Bombina bombina]